MRRTRECVDSFVKTKASSSKLQAQAVSRLRAVSPEEAAVPLTETRRERYTKEGADEATLRTVLLVFALLLNAYAQSCRQHLQARFATLTAFYVFGDEAGDEPFDIN